jgi:hypothetical protein
MRIEVSPQSARLLYGASLKKIFADENIKTWSVVKDSTNNECLTYNPSQWKNEALKPKFETIPERLVLTITSWQGKEPTEYIKGFYVGRFTEVLLEHYRRDYSKLETFAQ